MIDVTPNKLFNFFCEKHFDDVSDCRRMVYFSKKIKKEMKSRQKKAKVARASGNGGKKGTTVKLTPVPSSSSSNGGQEDSKKQYGFKIVSGGELQGKGGPWAVGATGLNFSAIGGKGGGKKFITIPEDLTLPSGEKVKDAKAYRKRIRREAKKELGAGYDEDRLVFVDGKGERKKRKFLNINEAVKSLEEEKVRKEEEEKVNKAKAKEMAERAAIPDSVKSSYVALDCEMVGVGAGGKKSVLARVSITNWDGKILLDTHVSSKERVTDFRTHVSGVTKRDIRKDVSVSLKEAQRLVHAVVKDKIVVGHALKNDFKCLFMDHPKHMLRDTARYLPYMRRAGANGGKPKPRKLRDLVREVLGDEAFQAEGVSHDSAQDAHGAMRLYIKARDGWEKEMEKKGRMLKKKGKGDKAVEEEVDDYGQSGGDDGE